MNKQFDNLESIEEMFSYIAENNNVEPEPALDLDFPQEMHLLHIQTFLKMYAKLKTLSSTDLSEFELCADAYNDSNNAPITRQSALAYVYNLFFPENELTATKEIARKDDSKVYQTPCEDCTTTPTHLVLFKTENRTEEHFLCEECEMVARAEDGDE